MDQFTQIFENQPHTIPEIIVFWLDYNGPEQKALSRRSLLFASQLADQGKTVYVIMKQMLVHGNTGQKQYDRARKLGVKFFRINDLSDVQLEPGADGIKFSVKDATLSTVAITFDAHWLIVPEKILPGPAFEKVANFLRLENDEEGFMQTSNVRHSPISCPRKGIFFCGSCHDEIDGNDLILETEAIVHCIDQLITEDPTKTVADVVINKYMCAQCLTCFRICPHSAVTIPSGTQPFIMSEACVSCGLCVSSCPAQAIEQKSFNKEKILQGVSKRQTVIFACERSAAIAAKSNGHQDNLQVIPVPCACRINTGMLLNALVNGAEKILVAGCHDGNCRSDKGSHMGINRAAKVNHCLKAGKELVEFAPFAANESRRFQNFIAGK
ncbi:MAG: hydrogenase iron-sulfur subunit [Desulfobacteraceae bacterium]|nr:hydrogenase iron-sulfur subunit [Desulfobacteraceae bacterium]